MRLVALYADACNFFGLPDAVAHKVAVLQDHCRTVGRDIGEIEITALMQGQPDWTPDDVLRQAEAYAAVGVATVMAGAMGDDPAGKLESLYGPAMDRLQAIQPRKL